MKEQIKYILDSMQALCKSAIEKSQGDVLLYSRLDELSDDIASIKIYVEGSHD
jgi:hypothetical protein